MKQLLALAGRRFRGPPPAPAPADPFMAIGDVHGRADLLEALLGRVLRACAHAPVVVLGDMIDRGPDSAGVLKLLHGLRTAGVICLRGNHEQMLLDFLDAPERCGGRWFRNGGFETLESFGIGLPDPEIDGSMERCAAELRARLGPLLPWLHELPLIWRSGNVLAVHAGLDPECPWDAQRDAHLIWGHPRFGHRPRRDGLWVVHGHVVQPEPLCRPGRIAIDTGAWFTGRLSAARIGAGTVEFMTEG
ncbi:metallophosphoesterase [Limimaricola cinnabarinus]|uniref:metallophosphoesterase n=1 Tax=Limimaricola cinnabarinus TaxID=1125964 RepID=UPI002490C71D|nr:metallophosphoesterase [Limimaricola cinnabarinus]